MITLSELLLYVIVSFNLPHVCEPFKKLNIKCEKINHFVTFDTYGQNNMLYSTSQPYSDYRVSVYTELPENL